MSSCCGLCNCQQQEKMNSKPGDWNCRSCQHMNFSWRECCQLCNEPRPGGSSGFAPVVRPGDWYCSAGNCRAHNFASRSSCFKCGAFKDEPTSSLDGDAPKCSFGFGGPSVWKSGDWMCTRPGCNEHNFASRKECFRCNAPKGSSS